MINRETLEKEYPNYKRCIKDAFEWGQSHVFKWWGEITPAEQKHLLKQTATIDFQFVHTLFNDNRQKTQNTHQGDLVPPQIITVPKNASELELAQRARQIGEASLRRGEIAVLTVAGGMEQGWEVMDQKGLSLLRQLAARVSFNSMRKKYVQFSKNTTRAFPGIL